VHLDIAGGSYSPPESCTCTPIIRYVRRWNSTRKG